MERAASELDRATTELAVAETELASAKEELASAETKLASAEKKLETAAGPDEATARILWHAAAVAVATATDVVHSHQSIVNYLRQRAAGVHSAFTYGSCSRRSRRAFWCGTRCAVCCVLCACMCIALPYCCSPWRRTHDSLYVALPSSARVRAVVWCEAESPPRSFSSVLQPATSAYDTAPFVLVPNTTKLFEPSLTWLRTHGRFNCVTDDVPRAVDDFFERVVRWRSFFDAVHGCRRVGPTVEARPTAPSPREPTAAASAGAADPPPCDAVRDIRADLLAPELPARAPVEASQPQQLDGATPATPELHVVCGLVRAAPLL